MMTADAMHAQRAMSWLLKVTQGKLHDDVRLYMDDPQHAENVDVSEETVEKGHGRTEIREGCVQQRTVAGACHDVGWLLVCPARSGWTRSGRHGAEPRRRPVTSS